MNNMQKVWVCGANGRVGQQIVKLLEPSYAEVFCTDKDSVDITVPEAVSGFAELNRPHYIINCAGMTDVTACEKNIEEAFKVNALGARNLSVAARKINAKLVQLSTDDVFDGEQQIPYNEFDVARPQSIYGKSKLAGENFVKELSPKHIIVRSSWIYGTGDNYVNMILKEAKEGTEIRAAVDQIASPTSALRLAEKMLELMEHAPDGLYHVTGQGYCSRYEFAKEILELAGLKAKLTPVTGKQDELTVMRPSYSVLDNLMLRMSEIECLPDWKESLKEYIQIRMQKENN